MSYDPYAAKMQSANGPTIVDAQPVNNYATPYGAQPTYAAAPVGNYVSPAAQAVQAQPQVGNNFHLTRPNNGRWRDSICDWPSNLFPSCYCACCCCSGMWLVAQSEYNYMTYQSYVFLIYFSCE